MRAKPVKMTDKIRKHMRRYAYRDDRRVLDFLMQDSVVDIAARNRAHRQAARWVAAMREMESAELMDHFMAEYGLSNKEGIALMCLAEALLRVPDSESIDALIEDKIALSDWAAHLGRSSSPLVNASTWGLLLTGRVLNSEDSMAGVLHDMVKRIGEPVIRNAVKSAIRQLGKQFVLGETIESALTEGADARKKGYTFSYDMLGEAAKTAEDAQEYHNAYTDAITAIASDCPHDNVRDNPGISIKLSALYERYEMLQKHRVMDNLVPRVLALAKMAKQANMGLNIDAEEAARLEISMDVIETVLASPELAGWDGFGIVVQAYGKRARFVIDWFHALAESLNRKVMLRLVKGAYWDSEIKWAQINGVAGFPVFTQKAATDISYIENAAHLLRYKNIIYPQFATHNAHTVAMVRELAGAPDDYEFQRLHGMGEGLYEIIRQQDGENFKCRIYAPVGEHEDLLAYLVRRLLENGANSSFVNQIFDKDMSPSGITADPYENLRDKIPDNIKLPQDLFAPRINSRGRDLNDVADMDEFMESRKPFAEKFYEVKPVMAGKSTGHNREKILNPATGDAVGVVAMADTADVRTAIDSAGAWATITDSAGRAKILRRAADIYEANAGEIFAILAREAGKTAIDAIAELREAVDFLRYYADEAENLAAPPCGIVAAISPWNFPLAIFTGQIASALAAGNGVIAKPAEATPIIAMRAVNWLHEAGVPKAALQLLPGDGARIGTALTGAPGIDAVCFTGSTATARKINMNMAENIAPDAPLVAETGGINAMIVDSTALPEQVVRDVIASAFQSAGQRCSACRVLFLQNDIAERIQDMLCGAMDALVINDPWTPATDIGPVINAAARENINRRIDKMRGAGRIIKEVPVPASGNFISPTLIALDDMEQLDMEIFGPVLHVVRYDPEDISGVIDAINASGYGLTFGMHSRIDDRIDMVCKRIKAGNIYINRNQIGAIVGSQPFGGIGLSGTGPKAGGPLYVHRFCRGGNVPALPGKMQLPGPTGESNLWTCEPRGMILCLGPTRDDAVKQAEIAETHGCSAGIAIGIDADALASRMDFAAAVYWGEDARDYRMALARREGAIIPLFTGRDFGAFTVIERHICVDVTASGGNTELLA